jgi:hypothetical protein
MSDNRNTSILAPIVLFVYNRPEHTLMTLEALSNNEFADKSDLYVYADGPKINPSIKDLEAIQKVKEIVNSRQWCKTVKLISSDVNYGLAASVIKGISEIVNKYGRIIVLEDDLVTSPFFLQYMNEGLETFESIKNIYSVNGFMFPIQWEGHHTVLLPFTSTWGWATWKDRWSVFDQTISEKKQIEENPFLESRFNLGDYDYRKMLSFGNNSWGIKWYYSVFVHHGLGVFPTKSLVNNIGFDGSGENCGELDFSHKFSSSNITIDLEKAINLKFYGSYLNYFKKNRSKLHNRIINKIKRLAR